jgi:hypothetical protein
MVGILITWRLKEGQELLLHIPHLAPPPDVGTDQHSLTNRYTASSSSDMSYIFLYIPHLAPPSVGTKLHRWPRLLIRQPSIIDYQIPLCQKI